MKYRKKPVEIEAIRVVDALKAAKHEWNSLPHWVADAYEDGDLLFLADAVEIRTLEGDMRGELADWLLQGVQGELYACKPDIFAKTYESADKPSASDRLAALEAAGVDNWEGYGHAMAILRGDED